MPYRTIEDLPDSFKVLPVSGQELALKVLNDLLDRGVEEGSAFAQTWAVIKRFYKKIGGKWVKMERVELIYRGDDFVENDKSGGKFLKKLIEVGKWVDPKNINKTIEVTKERMKKWVDNFKKNLVKVFIPLRHTVDPDKNTGWLEDLMIKGDCLYGILDIRDEEIAEKIRKGLIQDVSLGIDKNYVDNKGQKWGEVIEHVALTLVPHIREQGRGAEGQFKELECYEKLETAPIDMPWNLTTAEINDLPDEAFAWIHPDYPEVSKNKALRKLPHHLKDGRVVWRGVVAAMAALLGARGGVDIPNEDKKKVYNHLVGHYKEFDKEPPEFHFENGGSEVKELELVRREKEEIERRLKELEKVNEELGKKNMELEEEKKKLEKGGKRDEFEKEYLELKKKVEELESYKESKEIEAIENRINYMVEETRQVSPAIKERLRNVVLKVKGNSIELEGGVEKDIGEEILDIFGELPAIVPVGEKTKSKLEKPGSMEPAENVVKRIMETFRKGRRTE
jgi:cation transport regulator ChaB